MAEDARQISEAIHAGAGWCSGFVHADDVRNLYGVNLGYISELAEIDGDPESRGFDGTPINAVIHPQARIEAFVSVDAGTIRATEIGAHSWLFKHVHVGHDAHIGENVEVATGVVIGGFASIDDDVRIGLNATILPRQFVGKGARIGAGAVVVRDVPPGATVVGNPAREIRRG